MPDLISPPRYVFGRGHPVSFWIALTLHCVSRPRLNTIPGQARGNDNQRVFNRRSNNDVPIQTIVNTHEDIYR